MEVTEDMQAILDHLRIPGATGSTKEISFCTSIEEWSLEIDLEDMSDEGWISLSADKDDNTIATITGDAP